MIEIEHQPSANSYIRNLTPYQPGKPIEEVERELGISSAIKLASNENPLGTGPKAIAAVTQALEKMRLYPDGNCYSLKNTLSGFLQVNPNQLTIGNGSENILEMLVKAYLNPASSAVISQYAFLTIPLLIQSYGAELITVPATQFGHDIHNMIKAVRKNTQIIFIVNPNNPTGTFITQAELVLLLESIPTHILVVIDEAYHEYIFHPDCAHALSLLNQYPNLLITRTFSKAYGLAGLRLGYAISSAEIANILNRARLPFNVNMIAACAGEAALSDQEHITKTIMLNKQGMLQLTQVLTNLNIDYIPSIGNFVTLNVKQNALDVYQRLLHQGIIVRPLAAYDMPTYLRVTIGTIEQNEKFLTALKKVL